MSEEGISSVKQEDRKFGQKSGFFNEHFAEAETREALRILILQRFTEWLDDVLVEEKPLEGIAAELLAELDNGKEAEDVDPGAGAYDLHSTWSALTALTQEVKLQGRAFKQLSEKMTPFDGLETTIDKLIAKHHDILHEARRIAEEGRTDRRQRESELKLAAREDARRELIRLIVDIRDSLLIGLRSAAESRKKLKNCRSRSRLISFFRDNSEVQKHQLEILDSLTKGYLIGLDRVDESLQQLGVAEIQGVDNPFDPRTMNAVDIEQTGEVSDGTVLQIYRAGYMIDNEVLRPAQVKVARAPGKMPVD
jgi:molecular chaperone GrpE